MNNLIDIENIIRLRMGNCGLYDKVLDLDWNTEHIEKFKTISGIKTKKYKILNKNIEFYYCDKKIYFVFNEILNNKDLHNLIEKCLNDKQIIKALNNKEIELQIKITKEYYEDKIIKVLENIGINIKDIYNDEMFVILSK